MRAFLFFLLMTFTVSCNSGNESDTKVEGEVSVQKTIKQIFSGTYWKCKIADGCYNSISFYSDSLFVHYSCEMEDSVYGVYKYVNDTLMLHEKRSRWDNDFPEGSRHRLKEARYYAFLRNDTLRYVKKEDLIKGSFVKVDFEFDMNHYYLKED